MLYKRNYRQVIGRLNELYTFKGLDRIYAKMNIPNPALEEFKKKKQDGEVDYPDMEERMHFWDEFLSIYSDLEDDSIPSAYMSEFDQGLYGAVLGADIKFMQISSLGFVTSMVSPVVNDLEEARKLKLNKENSWFKKYIKQLRFFVERSNGKFGISNFILIDGLNFMMELRGATNTYYDLIDDPDGVKYAIEFAEKLNIWIHDHFFNTVGLYDGGTCNITAQWLPGRIVYESVDPFHLTSSDTFDEWGRETIQRIFNHFDGGMVHIHSNGHHLIEKVATLEKLKCIALYDDEFVEPVYKAVEQLDKKRGKIPYNISIPYEVFADRLTRKELQPNIFYNVLDVPDNICANKLMSDVKKYKG